MRPRSTLDDRTMETSPAQRFREMGGDVRYVLRSLIRSRGYSLAIIVTLALGLGVNTTIVSFLEGVFFRAPDGVPSPDGVRRLWLTQVVGSPPRLDVSNRLSYPEFVGVRAGLQADVRLALYSVPKSIAVGSEASAATASASFATGSYFSALGIQPFLGRWFTDDEAEVHTASAVAVVSHAFWQSRLGADSGAVGRPLQFDGRTFLLVGVARPTFRGIDVQAADVWLPLGTYPTREVSPVPFWESSVVSFGVFGRLLAGSSLPIANARANAAYHASSAADFPPDSRSVVAFASIIAARGPGVRSPETKVGIRLTLFGSAVLIIACANVINLFMARTLVRRREIAIRLALGSGGARLARLFVTESTILALGAGAAAVMANEGTAAYLRTLLLPGTQFASSASGPMSRFVALGLALVVGVVIGLVTARHGSRVAVATSLSGGRAIGGRGATMLTKSLVLAQSALSVVLLSGAALLIESFVNIRRINTAIDIPRVGYAVVVLPGNERPDTLGFSTTVRSVGERVRQLAGVEAVAFARADPMTMLGHVRIYTETESSEASNRPEPYANSVSAEFFGALGLRFLSGRGFTDGLESTSQVVVNRTLAGMFWPGADAVGRCVYLQSRDDQCLTIVGVVDDAIRSQLGEEKVPQVYLPIFHSARGARPPVVVFVRSRSERLTLKLAEAAGLLRGAFPSGHVTVTTMAEQLEPQYRPWRLGALLFSALGFLALGVAALGIYGNVAFATRQRERDFAVRLALGATRLGIIRHVVTTGVLPVLVGSLVGLLLSIAAGTALSSSLYGVSAWNPLALGSSVAALIAAAILAALIPALRVSGTDPMAMMKAE